MLECALKGDHKILIPLSLSVFSITLPISFFFLIFSLILLACFVITHPLRALPKEGPNLYSNLQTVSPANLSIVGELPWVLCSNRVKLTLEACDTWVWLPFSVFHEADMLLLSSSLFKDFLFFPFESWVFTIKVCSCSNT